MWLIPRIRVYKSLGYKVNTHKKARVAAGLVLRKLFSTIGLVRAQDLCNQHQHIRLRR